MSRKPDLFFSLAVLLSLPAPFLGQDFRRGDSNADGRVDLADGTYTLRWLFVGGASPPCLDAAEASDDGDISIVDPIYTLNSLFTGATPIPIPGVESCGGDPTTDTVDCASYNVCDFPVLEAPGDTRFELQMKAPQPAQGPAGSTVQFPVFVELCNTAPVEGWSFGIRVSSDSLSTCSIIEATSAGTAAEVAQRGGYDASYEVTDPAAVTSAVVLHLKNTVTLPVTGTGLACTAPNRIFRLTLEATVPEGEGECRPCILEFAGDVLAHDLPVPIVVSVEGQSFGPGVLAGVAENVCEGDPIPPFPSTNVLFQLEDTNGHPGGAVTVPFIVQADRPSQGFAYSIEYDPGILAYAATEKLWQRPSGTPYDFEKFEANEATGHLVGAAIISLTDSDDVLPPFSPVEVLGFHFVVNPDATAGTSTELAFADGGQGSGAPVANKLIAGGQDITPEIASSFVFVNARIGIVGDVSVFVRGDSDLNGTVNIADPTVTLNHLFLGSTRPACLDAADANDSGNLDISDPIATLQFLFLGAEPLPPPRVPGTDPTADALDCAGRS
jgi:hypothetical protein